MRKILLAGLILFFSYNSSSARIKTMIVLGPVYEIKERDIIEVIKERAEKFDTAGYLKEQYHKAFHPESLKIPITAKNNILYVDPTSELSSDIKDAEGKVIYKAGYRFNILELINLRPHLFIDGTDPRQVEMVGKLKKELEGLTVNLTAGDAMDLRKKTDLPIYFANREMLERFGIERVPSLVIQEGSILKVKEIIPSDGQGKN